MTRNLKALGLALVAVFAMGALAASAAQAAETPHFTALNTATGLHEGVKLHGTSESEANGGVQKFVAGIGTVECYHAEFEAESTGTAETLTVGAKYFGKKGETNATDCETSATWTTHVNMEGCHYTFHITNTINENESTGTVDVNCEEGKEIDIKITKLGSTETKCTVKIPGDKTNKGEPLNQGLKHVLYHRINTTTEAEEKEGKPKRTDTTVEATVEPEAGKGGITYTSEGSLLNCGVSPGRHEGATYTGNAIVSGENAGGSPMDVTVMPVSTP